MRTSISIVSVKIKWNLIGKLIFLSNSLKNAKKHGSRRPNKNSQQISIITSENSGLNPNGHQSQMQQTQQQQIYDNRMNTQVKTYTDQGNGHNAMRAGNSSHYSKVSAGFSLISSYFVNKS